VWLEKYFKALEEKTGGKVKAKVYYKDQIAKIKELFDALSAGTLDAALTGQTYYSGKEAAGDALWLPFAFTGYEDFYDAWFNYKGLKETIREAYKKHNILFLGPTVLSPEPILWRGEPATKLEDVKGKKIRAAGGIATDIVDALGGVPVAIHSTEVYIAVQRGILDGVVFPLYALEVYRLKEVIKGVTLPAVIDPCNVCIMWNLDAWNKLGPELQKVAEETFKEIAYENIEWWKKYDEETEEAAKAMGVKFVTLSPEEQKRWTDAMMTVWDKYAARGDVPAKLVEILKKRRGY